MLRCWEILLVSFFVLSTLAEAGPIDTIRFDPGLVIIDDALQTVGYSGLTTIDDPQRPSVPVFYAAYHADLSAAFPSTATLRVLRADTVEIGFVPVVNSPDRITSDLAISVTQPAILEATDRYYPSKCAIWQNQQKTDQVIWTFHIFPIQYLDNSRIIINTEIELGSSDGDDRAQFTAGLPDSRSDHNYAGNSLSKVLSTGGCPVGMEYVVVTSPTMLEAFESFVDLKRQTGYDIDVAITDSIFARYDGIDEAEALRNYLIMFYLNGGHYVLLGGDENQVPVRYAYFYNTDEIPAMDQLMMCDLYYADCTGDWDTDGDGIWGEPTADMPDLAVELLVGRLPFSRPEQVITYTKNLTAYLFNPGNGYREYLDKSVFFTSDQMRDYFEGGQQYVVAECFPEAIEVDCESLAETPSGDDPSPIGPLPTAAISGLNDGYGIINILAHGRPDGFVLKSSEYNLFPKSYMLTGSDHAGHGSFGDLSGRNRVGFCYTIACSQGAFDLETVYDMPVNSVVEEYLSLDSAGVIGMVAFSRWGWVGSSYRFMESFYDNLFDEAGGYSADAMYRTYLEYPYYVDQVYGQNYYGDPSVRIYRESPDKIALTVPEYYKPGKELECTVAGGVMPAEGYPVYVRFGSSDYDMVRTDAEGVARIDIPDDLIEGIAISCFLPGMIGDQALLQPSIVADADDDEMPLPLTFGVDQNYPNPFNPATTIGFTLTRQQAVSLIVYDILGRMVDRPLDGTLNAGEHEVIWAGTDINGRPVSSGIYIYRLVSEEGAVARKMTLLK